MNPLIKKVVVAYNGSSSSLKAVMYGIMLSKQLRCELKVVYVVDVAAIRMLTLSKFMVASEGEKIRLKLLDDGEHEMEFVRTLARSKGVVVQTEVRQGAIWSEVIACADDYRADLILLGGTSGSSNMASLKHDVIGTQDGEIIGSAHCSVMVVREPLTEQLFKIC